MTGAIPGFIQAVAELPGRVRGDHLLLEAMLRHESLYVVWSAVVPILRMVLGDDGELVADGQACTAMRVILRASRK